MPHWPADYYPAVARIAGVGGGAAVITIGPLIGTDLPEDSQAISAFFQLQAPLGAPHDILAGVYLDYGGGVTASLYSEQKQVAPGTSIIGFNLPLNLLMGRLSPVEGPQGLGVFIGGALATDSWDFQILYSTEAYFKPIVPFRLVLP